MTDQTNSQPVPLLDLKAQYATIKADIDKAVMGVVESQYFILGPEVQALEEEIAAYCNANYGIGMTSGTDALLVALMALDIGPGDEVITTPYSFFATAGAIARLRAKPVFVDIDPLTYNIDPAKIEAAITERTRVILPVHLFGQMADMDPIMDVAKKHNLYVVEDAAQAIGCEYNGQRAGSVGHFGCFSFYPSKNLGAFGDGGMITANDPDLAERARRLRNHGYREKYFSVEVGGNFRLDAMQAAVLRVKLPHLDRWSEGRQQNAATYRQMFAKAGLTIDPADVPCLQAGCQAAGQPGKCDLLQKTGLVMPLELPGYRHIYNQFVIRGPQRDELMAFLKSRKIGCEVYYPYPFHLQDCFSDLGYKPGDFPASECAALETLALPIYPELTEAMQQTVVDAIATFYKQGGSE